MDLSRSLEALAIKRLDSTALSELEDRIDRHVGTVISRDQALHTYLGWLREQLVQDTFYQQESLVKDWIDSLRNRGYEQELIFRFFKDWQRREAQNDPLTRRRFLLIEENMRAVLEEPQQGINPEPHLAQPSHRPSQKENRRPHPAEPAERKKPAKSRKERSNRQRTGANEIPVSGPRRTGISSSHEVIVIHDSPSEPDRFPTTTDRTPPVHGDAVATQPPYDPDELMITRETIWLDTTPEKVRTPSDQAEAPQSRENYMTAFKTGALDQRPPGHWVNFCPTNLDPRFDVPPDPKYLCKYCGRRGVHFATLCPHNKNDWSLTQQRKKSNIQAPTKSLKVAGDSYRPGESSGSRRRHAEPRFQSRLRENRSRSPIDRDRQALREPRSPSPFGDDRHHRRSYKDGIKLYDEYRPAHYDHEAQAYQAKSSRRRKQHQKTVDNSEGRLYYEDDVFFTGIESPSVTGASPQTRWLSGVEEVTSARSCNDSPAFSENNAGDMLTPEGHDKAAADAHDFLEALREQIQDNGIESVCASELNKVVSQVCSEKDINLIEGDNSALYEMIANPPFSDEVVRLFCGRANPIICPRRQRPIALEFWRATCDE
ncbi:hypothetical protein JX265_003429 [Neoarthrinium moseri]|uniref:CCHC-type domain-containing protein n=1 Tax=Neoarthrinium moseri TaxID=1658444 RepID=A0A9P9WRX9_9PEZI|nr:hypothetical protein JX265_003429 [Neoarthrinium moseri]